MIIVKDFGWSQSEDEVIIRIPMKKASDPDILTSENYVKIFASPYFFEAFLLHPINEEESRCQLIKDEARFFLKKLESIEWESLERAFESREEKQKLKQRILEKVQDATKERIKKNLEKQDGFKRAGVDYAIEKDAKEREAIENIQKSACSDEMKKVTVLKANENSTKIPAKKTAPPKVSQITVTPKPSIPEIRKSATIEISFSQRNFVTPKRESQDPAEQEWLLKQSEARKAMGFVEEDLSPEERNPQWLKEKGDDFFKKKNYLAAISAYTTGIRLADRYHELYMNRSAAQMAMKNYQRCAEDCSKALELLTPPVEANRKARVQCLARRGAALCQLGFLKQGYDELVAAVKLDPEDQILRHDAEMIRCKLENYEE
jgi:dyslexia susceptibility 1 candidate gene 1 protein